MYIHFSKVKPIWFLAKATALFGGLKNEFNKPLLTNHSYEPTCHKTIILFPTLNDSIEVNIQKMPVTMK